jgi:hypothetical protein
MGKHLAWWPMEGFKLNGPWKVSNLVTFGMFHVWLPLEGEGKISFSPPSTFHPIRFYLNIFSIDFKVLFYHGFRPLLHIFPSFPLIYKLQSHISKYQVFHILIVKLILIKDFFLSLNSWCWGMTMSYGPQAT